MWRCFAKGMLVVCMYFGCKGRMESIVRRELGTMRRETQIRMRVSNESAGK